MYSTQHLYRDFIRFVAFSVISMLGQSLFILADTYFIANGVGAQGLAALNIVLPTVNIINGMGWMFGVGGATQFALSKIRQQTKEANQHFTQTMLTALFFALLFTLLAQLFKRSILVFLGATPDLYPMANQYFSILSLFAPLFILNNSLITFIRNDNNPRLAMVGMLLGGLFNIVFDYIFIYIFKWGLAGAAIATVFSPAVSLIVCAYHFKTYRHTLAFQRINFKLDSLLTTIKNGFSSFLNEFSSGLVMLIFNLVIVRLAAETGVAAYGIVANMNIIAIAIFTGVGQGFQPLLSTYYGDKNLSAVKKVGQLGLITSFIISAIMVLIGWFIPDIIVAFFNGDNNLELARLAEPGIRYYFTSFIFTGFNFTFIYFLSAVYQGKQSMIISALRGFIFVMPVVYLMSRHYGLNGVWWSMTIVEALTFIIGLIIVKRSSQKISTKAVGKPLDSLN